MKLAASPWNLTEVVPVRLAPERITVAPGAPDVGLKLLIRGATLNSVLLTVPPLVVMEMGPLVALTGTTTVILVLDSTVNLATDPLKRTLVAPMKLVPVNVMVDLGVPDDAERLVIRGAAGVISMASSLLLLAPLPLETKRIPLVMVTLTVFSSHGLAAVARPLIAVVPPVDELPTLMR